MRTTLSATFLLFASSLALASTPNLTGVRPVGGQRGIDVEVTLQGARLQDAQEILYYQPGISTVKSSRS